MKRVLRFGAGLVLIVLVTGLAVTYAPQVIWPDRPVPAWLAPNLEDLRRDLQGHANDRGLVLHLTFIEARCDPDGSVAVIFEEHRPPYLATRHAYVGGSREATGDVSWGGGGYGIEGSLLADAEFIHLFGADPPVCAE
jgi:hypothetical protein